MDHAYFRDKISAFSDGALEAQERELISRHLEECADCRKLLERLNHLSAVVEEKSRLENDEYFEKLAKRIEQGLAAPDEKIVNIKSMHWNSFWWKISAAAATVILVGTIGFFQYQDDDEMPAKVLEEFRVNQAPAPVMTDTATANEEAELQGGRTDSKELIGKVTESEKPPEKKEENNAPIMQEKDQRVKVDEDEIRKSGNFITKPSVVSQPAELKAKVSDEKAAALEAPDVGTAVTEGSDLYSMSDAISDSSTGQQLNLSQWRSQRDSIQNVLGLEQDTVVNSVNSRLQELAAPSASGLVKVDESTKVYQELANTWYQIALQTPDVNEKNRAVQFLNWYKNRFPTDSPAVNVQLQQVPK